MIGVGRPEPSRAGFIVCNGGRLRSEDPKSGVQAAAAADLITSQVMITLLGNCGQNRFDDIKSQ